jgi:hypothetical protein
MRFRNILLLLGLSCALVIEAQDISLAQAEATARGFVQQRVAHGAAAPQQVRLSPVNISDKLAEVMYVFNVGEQEGFVIVSGNSRTAAPVLGYSDEGGFDPEALPDNVNYWLQCYADQIECLNALPPSPPAAMPHLGNGVLPLLGNVRWNQDAPFNKMVIGDCMTGCVATSMAQVMHYHRWPPRGTGSHSFLWQGHTELSVDFSQSVYDWDNMLPFYGGDYTDEQADAVARLMYDCGVSIDMNYGNSSGAMTADVLPALINYFDYDNGVRRVMRDEYPMDEWTQLLCNELESQRPIMFEGRNGSSGHSFVMDGYNSEGYFHINWGWGGIANGYYLMTAMDPYSQGIGGSSYGYGFSSYQGAIIGIQKKQGDEPPFVEPQLHATSIYLTQSDESPNNAFNIEVTELTNQSGFTGAFTCLFDLMDEEGSVIHSYDARFSSGLPSYRIATGSIPVNLSELQLKDGIYYIKPRFVTDAEPMVDREIRTKFTQAKLLKVIFANDTVLLDNGTFGKPELSISRPEILNERLVAGHQMSFNVTVSNIGEHEYYGPIIFRSYYFGPSGASPFSIREQTSSDLYVVDIMPGDSTTIRIDMALPDSACNYYPTAKYFLGAVGATNATGYFFITQVPGYYYFSVEKAEEDPQLVLVEQLTPSEPVMPLNRIAGKAVLRNEGGYCDDVLEVLITPGNKSSIFATYSQRIFLNAGEEKEIEFVGEMLNGAYDTDYRMVLRNPKKPNTPTPWGSLKTFRTGPEPIMGDVTGDGVIDVSDVNLIINMMLGKTGLAPAGDLNGDGKIDVSDINAVINIMLGK